jgi:6-phospho-beta-glucosidase
LHVESTVKISVIGGSSVATVQLALAMAGWMDDHHIKGAFELALFGRDEHRLSVVRTSSGARLAERVKVTSTTNLEVALVNADIVLVQLRVGGLEARRFDESFPHLAAIPGEETLGPGGFANALRTVPVVATYFASIAQIAPSALVVNLTNPAGIVRRVGAGYGLRIAEVCEAPHVLLALVANALGRTSAQLFDRYVGLNHVGFYVPRDVTELDKLRGLVPIADDAVDHFGALPLAYVRYYVDPATTLRGQVGKPTRADQLMALEHEARVVLERGTAFDTSTRPAPWYSLAVMPLIDGLVRPSTDIRLIGTANGWRLPGLSPDSTIEGPATIAPDGSVVNRDLADLSGPALDLLTRHARYEDLALAACLSPTRHALHAALAANPMVSDEHQIATLVETMVSSPYGPSLVESG